MKKAPPEYDRIGTLLGQKIVLAVHAWGDEYGPEVDTRALLVGFHFAITRFLHEVDPKKRRGYVESLTRELLKNVDEGTS